MEKVGGDGSGANEKTDHFAITKSGHGVGLNLVALAREGSHIPRQTFTIHALSGGVRQPSIPELGRRPALAAPREDDSRHVGEKSDKAADRSRHQ